MKNTFTSILKTRFRNILFLETCRACLHRLRGPPYPIQPAEAANASVGPLRIRRTLDHKAWSCSSAGASGQGWLMLCVPSTVSSGSTQQTWHSWREPAAWPGFPSAQAVWMHPALLCQQRVVKGRGEGICNNLISNNQQLNYTKKLNQRWDGKYNL